MKKYVGYIIATLSIVLIILLVCVFMRKNENQNGTQNKSGVELISIEEKGSIIIQKFNAYLNKKTIPIEIEYSSTLEEYTGADLTEDYTGAENIVGKLNDTTVFFHEVGLKSTSTKSNLFNKSTIQKEFNVENFHIVKGKDNKEYLAINTKIYDGVYIPNANYLYILNDNLEVISNQFEDLSNCSKNSSMTIHPGNTGPLVDENPWYKDEFTYKLLQEIK